MNATVEQQRNGAYLDLRVRSDRSFASDAITHASQLTGISQTSSRKPTGSESCACSVRCDENGVAQYLQSIDALLQQMA